MANPHISMTVTCCLPGCGKQKEEVNHWYLITPGIGGGWLFTVYEWRTETISDRSLPVCGQAHLLLMLSRLMNGQEAVCKKRSS
jgi:hypothetical protein